MVRENFLTGSYKLISESDGSSHVYSREKNQRCYLNSSLVGPRAVLSVLIKIKIPKALSRIKSHLSNPKIVTYWLSASTLLDCNAVWVCRFQCLWEIYCLHLQRWISQSTWRYKDLHYIFVAERTSNLINSSCSSSDNLTHFPLDLQIRILCCVLFLNICNTCYFTQIDHFQKLRKSKDKMLILNLQSP